MNGRWIDWSFNDIINIGYRALYTSIRGPHPLLTCMNKVSWKNWCPNITKKPVHTYQPNHNHPPTWSHTHFSGILNHQLKSEVVNAVVWSSLRLMGNLTACRLLRSILIQPCVININSLASVWRSLLWRLLSSCFSLTVSSYSSTCPEPVSMQEIVASF